MLEGETNEMKFMINKNNNNSDDNNYSNDNDIHNDNITIKTLLTTTIAIKSKCYSLRIHCIISCNICNFFLQSSSLLDEYPFMNYILA